MNQNVHIIVTGGTIDSIFSPSEDAVIVNDHSVILEYLNDAIHPKSNISVEVLTLKDSREITDNIRSELVNSIKKSKSQSILITHGTYTMPETAKYLSDALPDIDKTIVLTGSMLPIKGFSESDAPFNLGYAIASSQNLPAGVYLAMNSQIFDPDNVTKNTEIGVFEEIDK